MKSFIDIHLIVSIVCNYYNLTKEQLFTRTRAAEIKEPRQIFHYLAVKYTKENLSYIGRQFGGFHHSTIISSCKKVSDLIETEKLFRRNIYILEHQIVDLFTTEKDDYLKLNAIKRIVKGRISLCSSVEELNIVLSNFKT